MYSVPTWPHRPSTEPQTRLPQTEQASESIANSCEHAEDKIKKYLMEESVSIAEKCGDNVNTTCSSESSPRAMSNETATHEPTLPGERRVSFAPEITLRVVHEITPYAEIFGIHPRLFDFSRNFYMVPARGFRPGGSRRTPGKKVSEEEGEEEDTDSDSDSESDSDDEWEECSPSEFCDDIMCDSDCSGGAAESAVS